MRGTVNDPTPFPTPSRVHGSHHWAFERLLSVALVPMTVSAFVVSPTAYPILDGVLAMSLVVHSHIGVSIFHSIESINASDILPRQVRLDSGQEVDVEATGCKEATPSQTNRSAVRHP